MLYFNKQLNLKTKNLTIFFIIISLILFLNGCASTPDLYPNNYYKQVGKEQADKDIKVAMDEAKKMHLNSKWKKNAAREGKSIAEGAAVGAGMGLFNEGMGLGAVAGAVSGFLWGMVSWLIPSGPTQEFKNYVNMALEEKGYRVIGWS